MASDFPKNRLFDLIIVGGGPAGISAAIEATRLGLKSLLIERKSLGGTICLARRVDNFPPWPACSGPFLAELFKKRFMESGVSFLKDEVKKITYFNSGCLNFKIGLQSGKPVKSRTIILATGQKFFIPDDLKFLKDFSLFPDEIELKNINKAYKVVMVGGGEVALDQALLLKDYGASVTVLVRSQPRANILLREELVRCQIKMFTGVKPVSASRVKSGKIVLEWESSHGHSQKGEFDLVIVACGKKPEPPELAGIKNQNLCGVHGRVSVKSYIPGLFLAGDLKNGRQRYLSLAVADGIRAAQHAAWYLKELNK